ncbi:MAG: ATP-binding cassette domain-containing protein [Gemmatimonadaceae bacterium]
MPTPSDAAEFKVNALDVKRGDFELKVPRWSPPTGLSMVIGPNGAGKTTLFKAVSGMLPTPRSTVTLNDLPIQAFGHRLPEVVRYMPDTIAGIPTMSVDRHVALAAAAFGARWDADYAQRLRERLRLTDGRDVKQLSRGNAAKLSFLCAEAARPLVLLLDEPTAGLDPFARTELLSVLADCLAADPERRIIMATHLLDDLSDFVQAMYVVADGRLQYHVEQDELRKFRELDSRSRQAQLLVWCPQFAGGHS